MNIVVCAKEVPETADAELALAADGTDLEREDLVMGINEWDGYAVEQAVRLKESHGATVTVVTIGDEQAEDVLRRALAMGVDHAVHIDAEDFAGSDAVGIARGLGRAIARRPFDLVLTGAQSADTGWAQVGAALAELLGLPYATLAVGLEIAGSEAVVERELEASLRERVALPLPALVTVQTGINEPRYVSVMGIRKARAVAIERLDADALGLGSSAIGADGSAVSSCTLSLPTRGAGAQRLQGSLDQMSDRVVQLVRERAGGAS